ncbi:hypothetical protein ACIBBD_18010 [Streptomyces sp. NPDC051315]|uniref:hypothetical protein n=1 Tax=Streptomyces sp. NPDC051315 TaxID=3365650 RepID=UPI0037A91EC5
MTAPLSAEAAHVSRRDQSTAGDVGLIMDGVASPPGRAACELRTVPEGAVLTLQQGDDPGRPGGITVTLRAGDPRVRVGGTGVLISWAVVSVV